MIALSLIVSQLVLAVSTVMNKLSQMRTLGRVISFNKEQKPIIKDDNSNQNNNNNQTAMVKL